MLYVISWKDLIHVAHLWSGILGKEEMVAVDKKNSADKNCS